MARRYVHKPPQFRGYCRHCGREMYSVRVKGFCNQRCYNALHYQNNPQRPQPIIPYLGPEETAARPDGEARRRALVEQYRQQGRKASRAELNQALGNIEYEEAS